MEVSTDFEKALTELLENGLQIRGQLRRVELVGNLIQVVTNRSQETEGLAAGLRRRDRKAPVEGGCHEPARGGHPGSGGPPADVLPVIRIDIDSLTAPPLSRRKTGATSFGAIAFCGWFRHIGFRTE